MFICKPCNKNSIGQMNKVVVEKRPRTYSYVLFVKDRKGKKRDKIILADQQITEAKIEELKSLRYKQVKRWQTSGWEIVKEEIRCNKCISKRDSLNVQ